MNRCRLRAKCGFRHDTDAVEGLPLRLIIAMVILAITVPATLGSFRAYDRNRVETCLLSEIDALSSAVKTVYISGPGNSAAIEFNPVSGSMTDVESVTFGDIPGGDMASAIRYRLQGRAECIVPVVSPNVPMSGADGAPLRLTSGNYVIMAECMNSGTDLNADGYGPDAFVCLSIIP
jgi:hypothetical protein